MFDIIDLHMFSRKTLFIVGAGASAEVGLPIGSNLAGRISDLFSFKWSHRGLERGDSEFLGKLNILLGGSQRFNEHIRAARQIAEGVRSVQSIDRFIDTHRHDPRIALLGKAAIAYAILKSEAGSRLVAPRDDRQSSPDLGKLEASWYPKFGRVLIDGVPHSERAAIFDNIKIVCFNYDRCIEQFLTHWLMSVYSIDFVGARELVKKLTILRPYGCISPFPTGNMHGVEYGDDAVRLDLVRSVQDIKTFTEQIEAGGTIDEIRNAMCEAETIVFLGFAFLKQNLKLIAPEMPGVVRRIFATAHGFSDSDAEDIVKSIGATLSQKAKPQTLKILVRNDLKCADLFDEYSRTLSA